MNAFDALVEECLDALREGRWSVDECLRRYSEHADALRPLLLSASSVVQAYQARPREEFIRAARERFLIASGERLQEAYREEPSPSFFAAARVRFLMAAHRMRLGELARAPRSIPLFGTAFRALASAGAAAVLLLSFSTYTVASAADALPGEWRYPVKRQTERVRLALAFGDDAERQVRLGLAAERSDEIRRLAQKGKIIGPGVLEDLARETEALVADVDAETWNEDDVAKLEEISKEQKALLAQVRTQIAPGAQDELGKAVAASTEGVAKTLLVRIEGPRPPAIRPDVPLAVTTAPEPTKTVDAASPAAGGTALAPPTATPVPSPQPDVITVAARPETTASGIEWVRVTQGRFTALIPSPDDGWRLSANLVDGSAPASPLIRLSNTSSTEFVTLNPLNGDMYWFLLRNGRFEEAQLRGHDGAQILVVDREALQAVYGPLADLPLFILDSIEVAPEPTPTPLPTDTPEATPALPE
jgi:hypothetical protein